MCPRQLCGVRSARSLCSETWLTCLFVVLTKTAYLAFQPTNDSDFSARSRALSVVPGNIQLCNEKVNSSL